MKVKKIIAILMVLCCATCFFTGCLKKDDYEDEDVMSDEERESYALTASTNNCLDLYSGQYYVWHNEDEEDISKDLLDTEEKINKRFKDYKYNIFTPVKAVDSVTEANLLKDENYDQFITVAWMTDKQDKAVPILHPGDELIYYTVADMPDGFTFTYYDEKYYSLGMAFMQGDSSGHYFLPLDENYFADDSSSFNIFTTINNNEESEASKVVIDSINDTNITTEYVDETLGVITGLEPNGKYTVNAYYGTVHTSFDVTADCKILTSNETFSSTVYDYELYNSTIAVIDLPDNLKDGYYYINDMGFFRYESQIKTDIDTNTSEITS